MRNVFRVFSFWFLYLNLSFICIASEGAYFSGKTIEWIVPFKKDGGADHWARFNAPYLSKYLPGTPKVIVKNIPGGGSIKAANAYEKNALPDGLTLLGTSSSTKLPYLLGDKRVTYDFNKWQVLLMYSTGGVVYVSSSLGIDSYLDIAKLGDKKLVYGSQGATSLDMIHQLGFDVLGLDVSTFFGIRGRAAGRYAFEKGIANIDTQTSASYIKSVLPMVEQGTAIPLYSMGALNAEGDLVRDPQFPDLPTLAEVYELLEGHKPTGAKWNNWFSFFSVGFGAQKSLVLPISTPQNIVDIYHSAFEQMLADPEYIAKKNKVLGSYKQLTGTAAVRLYQQSIQPNSNQDWIRQWLLEKFNLKIK